MAKKVSSDAERLLSNATAGERDYVLQNAAGGVATSGETSRLLQMYRTANPYSATNINSMLTGGELIPDYNDPLGYQSRLEQQLGVVDARNQYRTLYDQLRTFDEQTLGQQNSLENKLVLQDVITGSQANQARLRNQERVGLTNDLEASKDFLLAKQGEVDKRLNIFNQTRETMGNLILQYPGAKIQYTDTMEQAASKIQKFQKEEAKAAAKAQEKSELKKLAIQYGISTKGKSSKEIRKKIEKAAKEDRTLERELKDLEKRAKEASIADTYSQIANRGTEDTADIDMTDKGIMKGIDQAVNSGMEWADIAAMLVDKGIKNIGPGSTADRYLQWKFLAKGKESAKKQFGF